MDRKISGLQFLAQLVAIVAGAGYIVAWAARNMI